MRMESGSRDQFPVGMRVLAVDDDPTCLRLLERLLVHCKYHVTTTNQAIRALELLRGNKDDFDLVISDVHMPDMDGFKLLELIGLEMDLPVIMLSANSEYQNVMKGITHGACDYLVKPVRVEELRNVWQHVIRRKKFDAKDQNNSDSGDEYEKGQTANSEGGQDPVFSGGASDRNEKLNKKRKDQNGEDEDDCEENSNENEDPTTQKKPRVVWSIELHRKFVVAVNQLGIDKAVPKKILDLMNVERLTRENVASHLQKYRLYLKRLSAVATQQANMVSSFGGRNSAYHPMGSLEGFRNFHPLMGSRQPSTLSSLQPNGALSRMSSSTGFGLKNMLTTSRTAQHGLILNNTSNNVSELGNPQGIGLQGSQHLQRHKTLKETNNRLPGSFSGGGHSIGSSGKLVTNMTSNPLIMQANQQSLLSGALPSASSDSLKAALRDPPGLPNLGRCNDTWQGDLPLNQYSANSLSVAALSSHNNLYNVSPITSIMDPVASLANPVEGNSVQQTSACNPNLMFSYNLSSSLPNLHVANSTSSSSMLRNGFANGKMDMTLNGQNSGASLLAQNGMTDCQDNYKEGFALEKLHGEFSSNGCSFDELANAFSKPDQGDANFFDGDMASDIYSLGTCM